MIKLIKVNIHKNNWLIVAIKNDFKIINICLYIGNNGFEPLTFSV